MFKTTGCVFLITLALFVPDSFALTGKPAVKQDVLNQKFRNIAVGKRCRVVEGGQNRCSGGAKNPTRREQPDAKSTNAVACSNILQNVDEGILACTRVIESSPTPEERFSATLFRAHGYNAKGKFDDALRDFDDAARMNGVLRLDNIGPLFFHGRGVALVNKGELERAIADYNKAIMQAPKTAEYLLDRGVAHFKHGNFDSARSDFDEAIGLEPKLIKAYFHRAEVFQKKGAVDRAVRDLDEALRVNNRYPEAYALRGELYAARGEIDRAIRNFDEAIRLNPRFAAPYIHRGDAFTENGQYDRAIKDFNEAIWLDPRSIKVYVTRAKLNEKRGDFESARRDYDKALSIDSSDRAALEGRSIMFFKSDDFVRGLEGAREIVKLHRPSLSPPTGYEVTLLAGSLLKDRKAFRECVDVLSRGIDSILVPEKANYEIYYSRAQCHAETKQFDKAEADLKKALELFPDQPKVLSLLGQTIIERGGSLDEGLALIGRAADFDPEIAPTKDRFSDLLWKSWERARTLTKDKTDRAKTDEKSP
jgi:tetratricopeptide (TPR) repeat protein